MFKVAVGQMAIQPSEFWRMTPEEFVFAYQGYTERKEFEYKNGWEMTRLIAYNSLRPYIGKGQSLSPKDVMAFPWDEGGIKSSKPPTKKAMDKLFAADIKELTNRVPANPN